MQQRNCPIRLRLLGTGLGIVICFLVAIFLSVKYTVDLSKYVPSRGALSLYIGVTGVCVVPAYLLFRFLVGGKKADDLTSKGLEDLVRLSQRTR